MLSSAQNPLPTGTQGCVNVIILSVKPGIWACEDRVAQMVLQIREGGTAQ